YPVAGGAAWRGDIAGAGGAADRIGGVAAGTEIPLVRVGGRAVGRRDAQGIALAVVDGGAGRLRDDAQRDLVIDRQRGTVVGVRRFTADEKARGAVGGLVADDHPAEIRRGVTDPALHVADQARRRPGDVLRVDADPLRRAGRGDVVAAGRRPRGGIVDVVCSL